LEKYKSVHLLYDDVEQKMHFSDFVIGVKLILFSLAMGFFSLFIYPLLLDLVGWQTCILSPTVAAITSVLLLGLGVLIFILSFMLEEEE